MDALQTRVSPRKELILLNKIQNLVSACSCKTDIGNENRVQSTLLSSHKCQKHAPWAHKFLGRCLHRQQPQLFKILHYIETARILSSSSTCSWISKCDAWQTYVPFKTPLRGFPHHAKVQLLEILNLHCLEPPQCSTSSTLHSALSIWSSKLRSSDSTYS